MNESMEQLYPHTPEAVRAIIKRVRTMVQAAIPEATEIFYHSAFGYGTTTSGFDQIIYIAPQEGTIKLPFERDVLSMQAISYIGW